LKVGIPSYKVGIPTFKEFEGRDLELLQIYEYFMVAKYYAYIHNILQSLSYKMIFAVLVMRFDFLWSPYGIGQTIIFALWFLFSSFFFFLA